MLSLSQTTGYAILALGFMHECGGRLVLAKEITQRTGIPLPYLSKILHALSRTGLVVGKRGYQGGFALSRSADKVSLCDVAEAVEGRGWLPDCLLGFTNCTALPLCPIHDFWKVERAKIEKELRCMTLADVSTFIGKKYSCEAAACRIPIQSNLPPARKVSPSRNGRHIRQGFPRKKSRKSRS